MDSENTWKKAIFNVAGAFCALSLLLLGFYLIPSLFTGDFHVVENFFRQYPGSEPFVIFITPIILIIGPAWIWKRMFYRD